MFRNKKTFDDQIYEVGVEKKEGDGLLYTFPLFESFIKRREGNVDFSQTLL